jgi:hypothetical protein
MRMGPSVTRHLRPEPGGGGGAGRHHLAAAGARRELEGRLGLAEQGVEEHGFLVVAGADADADRQREGAAVDGDLEAGEHLEQPVRDDARVRVRRVRQHQQVAVVVGRAEQVGTARLLADHARDLGAHRLAQFGAVQIHQLRQAVDLDHDAAHRDAVAPRPRELVLHQVQDLRLREQRTAEEAVPAVAAPTGRRSPRAPLAKTWSAHRDRSGCDPPRSGGRCVNLVARPAARYTRARNRSRRDAPDKKIRASAGQN